MSVLRIMTKLACRPELRLGVIVLLLAGVAACSKKKGGEEAVAAPASQAPSKPSSDEAKLPHVKAVEGTAAPKAQSPVADAEVPMRQTPALREEARRKAMQEMIELRKKAAR